MNKHSFRVSHDSPADDPHPDDDQTDSLSRLEQALAKPILVLDPSLRIRRVSKEFQSLFPHGQLLPGQPFPHARQHDGLAMLNELLDMALLSRQRIQECVISDQQILQIHITPFYRPDGALTEIILLCEDETQTQKAVLEADRSNHVQASFLARMSHELRTPLNAIIGFTDVLLLHNDSQTTTQERQRDYLRAVQESGRYMLDLVENLLDVSRISSGPVQLRQSDVPLCQTMRSVMEELAPHAQQAEVALDVDCPQPLPVLRGDSAAIRRIVQNLLDNAIKYTPAGGRVRIQVGQSAHGLQMQIHDTGIGIHPDDLERIFNPFERGRVGMKHTREGAGLGLSIAKSLVLLQDGWIDVHSTLGQGTVVTVGFPRHRLKPDDAPQQETESPCAN